MIDRIISSAAILLCNMLSFWGPKVSLTRSKPGNSYSDWLELFNKNATGRALMYHLLFALLLNFSYGRNTLAAISMGLVIAYFLFIYILIPIHVKEFSKNSNNQQQSLNRKQQDSKNVNGNEDMKEVNKKSNKSNKDNSEKKNKNNNGLNINLASKPNDSNLLFIKKIHIIDNISIGSSALFVIWAYTNIFLISLIGSIIIVNLIKIKYTNHKDTILIACYLLGTAAPNYMSINLINIIGGLLIFNIYHLDKEL